MKYRDRAMHVLLIDSDATAVAQLGAYLEAHNHSVDYAASVTLALRLTAAYDFDAIVLASRLPALDGLALCRKLRANPHKKPVLLLLDEEASVRQTVAAFEAGADGYLAPPVAFAEVQARLKALLRLRRQRTSSILQLGDLELNLDTMEARRQGQRLALSPICLKLLQVLMEAAPRVLTYRELEFHLWGEDREDRCDSNLRAQIYGLRCKVDRPFSTALIQTRNHFGYRMVAPEENRGHHSHRVAKAGTERSPTILARTGKPA